MTRIRIRDIRVVFVYGGRVSVRIKTGDIVLVISGKDRTKKGKVLGVFPKENRLIVEGVNIRKKHQRPRRQGQKGEIIHKPAPLHISNVKLMCPKCSQAVRFGMVVYQDKKVRKCKKCKGEF